MASSDNPGDLEPSLVELNQDRPHCHHYTFAHMALRQVAFAEPVTCISILASPDSGGFLAHLWKQVDEHCRGRGETSTINPAEFVVHKLLVGNYPCAILEMPEPWFITGAYFVGLVLHVPLADINPEDRDAPLHYYTLERGASLDGQPRTVLCSWTGDGTHCNFGDGPPPTLQAFAKCLEERIVNEGGTGPEASFRPGK